jgi:hypothetical protein
MITETEINPTHTIGQMSIQSQELIKFLDTVEPGQIVTYSDMTTAAKMDVQAFPHIMQTARKNLQRTKKKAFGTVRGIGLKLLDNEDIPSESAGAIKRARRVAQKGLATLGCADVSKLSPEAKVRAITTGTVLGFMATSGSKKISNLAEQSAISNGDMSVGNIASLFNK